MREFKRNFFKQISQDLNYIYILFFNYLTTSHQVEITLYIQKIWVKNDTLI